MPFIWTTSPQLPSPPIPEQIPSGAISSKVDLVANTVNAGGVLVYNTAAEAYEVVYPTSNGGGTVQLSNTFEHINVTFANLTHITSNTINASSANITTIMSTSANIGLLYYPTIVNGNVSSDPNTPLGIASKQYVDNAINSISGISGIPTGQISYFSSPLDTTDWKHCTPGPLSKNTYIDLYNTMGKIYGEDTRTNRFSIPVPPLEISPFTEVANLHPRWGHASCVTNDGQILVTGGVIDGVTSNASMLGTFTPGTQTLTWANTNPLPGSPLILHKTIKLSDGRILLLGGGIPGGKTAQTWMGIISGSSVIWSPSNNLPTALLSHSVGQLEDNRVVVCGGEINVSNVSGNVIFGTINGGFINWVVSGSPIGSNTTSIGVKRRNHAMSILPTGQLMIVGGVDEAGVNRNEVYFGKIAGTTVTWEIGTPLPQRSGFHTMNLLPDNRVVCMGGLETAPTENVFVGTISNTSIMWNKTSPLLRNRYLHTSELHTDNTKLLMICGHDVDIPRSNVFMTTFPLIGIKI